ncbi:MAG: UvrD-helicase domain-containing protein [Treponema sp.]|nr:UvrD-helicase domain-containing protein [Treponema sp.]
MEKEVPPSSEQIKRLKALQGVDSGVFTLAVFSTLEGHMRYKLKNEVNNKTSFPDVLKIYRTHYSVGNPKEYMLFKNIEANERNTNFVRHRFENLSAEEAKAAIYLLSEFAKIFKLPHEDLINELATNLVTWNNRKSPLETAQELEKANKELQKLSKENTDMAKKVSELEEKQNQLSTLNTKLKSLQQDYDQQIANNKKNKDKIDELRRSKNEEEMKNRKAQQIIQEQIAKLSDAQVYIDNLARMTSYAIFAEWDKMDKISVQYANYKVVSEIDKGEYTIPSNLKTDYLFVDEVQDLTVTTLRLLKYSVNKNLILAGDNDQSVYQPGFAWTKANIDVVGNSRTLNVNFRSTIQIQEVAEKYRQLMKGFDKKNCPETFRIGAPVELHEEQNQGEAFESMLDSVNMCIQSLGYEPENICLIAGKRDYLLTLQGLLKEKLDLESDLVNSDEFSFAKQGVVRLATPQSCKGLDFPVVLYYLDHRAHFLNVYDEETADKMNRNMIYTAITRGSEFLHIFILKDSNSGPVDDLRKILNELMKEF